MKKITVLVAAILLAACSKPAPTEEKAAPAEQTAAVGEIYTGVLPAADGPGIKTTVALLPDGTFAWTSEYLEKADGVFEDKGTYTVENGVATLTIPQQEGYYLKLSPGQATLLDQDRQPITGELAEQYILKKAN